MSSSVFSLRPDALEFTPSGSSKTYSSENVQSQPQPTGHWRPQLNPNAPEFIPRTQGIASTFRPLSATQSSAAMTHVRAPTRGLATSESHTSSQPAAKSWADIAKRPEPSQPVGESTVSPGLSVDPSPSPSPTIVSLCPNASPSPLPSNPFPSNPLPSNSLSSNPVSIATNLSLMKPAVANESPSAKRKITNAPLPRSVGSAAAVAVAAATRLVPKSTGTSTGKPPKFGYFGVSTDGEAAPNIFFGKHPDVLPENEERASMNTGEVPPEKEEAAPMSTEEVSLEKEGAVPVDSKEVPSEKQEAASVGSSEVLPEKQETAPVDLKEVPPQKKEMEPVKEKMELAKEEMEPIKEEMELVKEEMEPVKEEMAKEETIKEDAVPEAEEFDEEEEDGESFQEAEVPESSRVYPFSFLLAIRRQVSGEGPVKPLCTADGYYSLPFLLKLKPDNINFRRCGPNAGLSSYDSFRNTFRVPDSIKRKPGPILETQQSQESIWRQARASGSRDGRGKGPLPVLNRLDTRKRRHEDGGLAGNDFDAWRLPSESILPTAPRKVYPEAERKRRAMKSILNKLTVEKFDRLYQKLLDLGLDNEADLKLLMELTFDKAKTEHHFIPMYVRLCEQLHAYVQSQPLVKVEVEGTQEVISDTVKDDGATVDGETKKATAKQSTEFKKLLVDECQTAFEKIVRDKDITSLIPDSLPEDEKFERLLAEKKRMKGTVIFVAELFKKKMVSGRVIIGCLQQLLQTDSELLFEALCEMLHACAGAMSQRKLKSIKTDFEHIMKRLCVVAEGANLSVRIRCLIRDVLDDWRNGWAKAQHEREGPKTLNEIYADALNSSTGLDRGNSRGNAFGRDHDRGRDRDRMDRGPSNLFHHANTLSVADEDGFTQVRRRGVRAGTSRMGADLSPIRRGPGAAAEDMIRHAYPARSTTADFGRFGGTTSRLTGIGESGDVSQLFNKRPSTIPELPRTLKSSAGGAPAKLAPLQPIVQEKDPRGDTGHTEGESHSKVLCQEYASKIAIERLRDIKRGLEQDPSGFEEAAQSLKASFLTLSLENQADLACHFLCMIAEVRTSAIPAVQNWLKECFNVHLLQEEAFLQGFKRFHAEYSEDLKEDLPLLPQFISQLVESLEGTVSADTFASLRQ